MLAEKIDCWNRELREERVRSADADRLLEWSERILAAASLQEVFRD